jgi:hypothetical protein
MTEDDRDQLDEFDEFDDDLPDEDQETEYASEEPEANDDYQIQDQSDVTAPPTEPTTLDETERLRQPRAQNFRRRLGNQVGMLPLALFLFAAGGLLIAKEQDIDGLPTFSSGALAGGFILALAFTAVFRSLLFGRRERGLLFLGLWIWSVAAILAGLIYAIDDSPDAAEWWPLLVLALAPAFLLTYVIERIHDTRLILLSILTIAAAGIALWITAGDFDQQVLDQAADYWPLLLSVIGIGILPLVFRRRTG